MGLNSNLISLNKITELNTTGEINVKQMLIKD